MKLYYASSVSSLAIRITVHELKMACDYESVDLKSKICANGDNYLSINPKGSVPALRLDDNALLTENAVILQYLADTNKAYDLLPPIGHMDRYRALEWLNYITTDLHRYCAPLFWSKIPETLKEDLFTPILSKKLSLVDQHLQNNTYLMGDNFTIGDPYLFVILVWLAKLKLSVQPWENLNRYFMNMKSRKSVQLALNEEGLSHIELSLN